MIELHNKFDAKVPLLSFSFLVDIYTVCVGALTTQNIELQGCRKVPYYLLATSRSNPQLINNKHAEKIIN